MHQTTRHQDWRGRDGTAFHIVDPNGSRTYLYAPSDRDRVYYECYSARFRISRGLAADMLRQARNNGAQVGAHRYIYDETGVH